MTSSQRLWTLVAGAAAALPGSLILPMALGHAAGEVYETCNEAVCLVMGNPQENWHYGGIRPFFTDWKADPQPYNVVVDQPDGSSIVAGSYDIKVDDFWNPFIAVKEYHYGDFTPSAAAEGLNLDLGRFADMTGAAVYNVSLGGYNVISMTDVGEHDMGYVLLSTPELTTGLAYTDVGTAAFIQHGDDAPLQLWNSLFHSWTPVVPDFLQPADPFTGMDFDPGDFVDWTAPNALTDLTDLLNDLIS